MPSGDYSTYGDSVEPADVIRINRAAEKALLDEVKNLLIGLANSMAIGKTINLDYLAEVTRRCKEFESVINETSDSLEAEFKSANERIKALRDRLYGKG